MSIDACRADTTPTDPYEDWKTRTSHAPAATERNHTPKEQEVNGEKAMMSIAEPPMDLSQMPVASYPPAPTEAEHLVRIDKADAPPTGRSAHPAPNAKAAEAAAPRTVASYLEEFVKHAVADLKTIRAKDPSFDPTVIAEGRGGRAYVAPPTRDWGSMSTTEKSIEEARPGDFLSFPASDDSAHYPSAIVHKNTVLDDAKRKELARAGDADTKKFLSSGHVRALEVDFSPHDENLRPLGSVRETWLYNESTKQWAKLDPSRTPPKLAVSDKGPDRAVRMSQDDGKLHFKKQSDPGY